MPSNYPHYKILMNLNFFQVENSMEVLTYTSKHNQSVSGKFHKSISQSNQSTGLPSPL